MLKRSTVRRLGTAVSAVALLGVAWVLPAQASANERSGATMVSAMWTAGYGSVLMVGSGPLTGFPLYAISSDAYGRYGCPPSPVVSTFQGAITCTGPESDIFNNVTTDEWPALNTTGAPIAGPGVDQHLLGSVWRGSIGRQVTYAGHPLYLFDPPSSPFTPSGEGFFETVPPLGPWHGEWFLVSAHRGLPAPGQAVIETGMLPDGSTVLAVETYPNAVPGGVAVTAYTFSRDHSYDLDCVLRCAVTWIPVLTSGSPMILGGVDATDVGTIRRSDGSEQVTYRGKPLYLYSSEQPQLVDGQPQASGTVGNGNGLRGPHGGTFAYIPIS